MDMIGEYVILGTQGVHTLLQALDRQTIRRINARCAQDTDTHPVPATKTPQPAFGIDPTLSTRGCRAKRPGFVDTLSGTVAINATGANVDESLW